MTTIDLYSMLQVSRTATQQEIKSKYKKLALLHHPDKQSHIPPEQRDESVFQNINLAYSILSDDNKRALYDKTGSISTTTATTAEDWMRFFKDAIKLSDLEEYEMRYKGSDEEREDLKKAFRSGKGRIGKIIDLVMFGSMEEERRYIDVLNGMISAGELEGEVVEMSEEERKRRRRKEEREAKMAKELSEKVVGGVVGKRQQEGDFLSHLESKYANKESTRKRRRK